MLPALRILSLLPLLWIGSGFAETPLPTQPFFQAGDGDTVVFLGDSITHQSLYTQYVEDFFYTRYPERRIRFYNAGVSGDAAADVLARFEEDVKAVEPDFVTVLLGMNDGKYEPFSGKTFSHYANGMEEIVARIQKSGANPVALSPTMFDHRQLALRKTDETFRFREKSFDEGYNSLMAYYGAWLRENAGAKQIPFVNLWGPLNDFTFAARRSQPDFSLVEDAIHPGAAGHFIMAFSLLSASQPERRGVSSIAIQERGGKWTAGRNEAVTDLTVSANREEISFTFLANALPWVVPVRPSEYDLKWGPSAPASLGYELTKAGHKLSAERLRVSGLSPGSYELRIDDVLIGTFTHLNLEAKVELQKYLHSPQSQQALAVTLLNRDRNDKAVRPMRDLWARVKGLRRKGDQEKFDQAYLPLKAEIDALHRKAVEFEERIYAAAQPVPRRYHLRRVGTRAKPGAKDDNQ
ncbi:MAG: SGNH/GDSL hydrolase family protein [Verrucomicrobiales bacterium]|nr:SGNH/GDSL hydrolase family protein [Verrucomicrobiales bacterium]